MRKKLGFVLCLVMLLLLAGCFNKSEGVGESGTTSETHGSSTDAKATEQSDGTEYDGARNPLTGLPIDEEWVNARPIAIMLNNLKAALPQQGNSQADIIYEALAEGGITRMLGVYQTVEGVGEIGSVRSSRPYYLELALGHDAIYMHAGGSQDAYAKIKEWNVTAMDFVRTNAYSAVFWRDKERMKNNGYEHSVLTSGDAILKNIGNYGFRLKHEDGYTYPQQFVEDGTPDGDAANVITVPFSKYKTGVFTYDEKTSQYLVSEYGSAYVDGNTGDQVAVTNVIVIRTTCALIDGDDAGRLTVDLSSGGDGWYACGGKIIPITWSKASRNDPLVYQTADGKMLVMGQGKSYVNIISLNREITVE
jgi:hypothetical protein